MNVENDLAGMIVLWAVGWLTGKAILLALPNDYFNATWRVVVAFILFVVSVAAFILGALVGLGWVA